MVYTEIIIIGASLLVSTVNLYLLKKTLNYKLIFYVYVLCGIIFPNYMLHVQESFVHYKEMLWLIAGIILAYSGLGIKMGVIAIIANSIGLGYFYLIRMPFHIEALVIPDFSIRLADFIEICFALFCIAYMLRQYLLFNELLSADLSNLNINLNKRNNENELLLKEVHHRVKNNLQIICSLLSLHKNSIVNDEDNEVFDMAINRIQSISLVHRKLYQDTDFGRVDLKSYIEELTCEIKSAHDIGQEVKLEVNNHLMGVDLNTIVPLGLILNELITNSYKHAFNTVSEPKIKIDISHLNDQDTFTLHYNDNGIWKIPKSGGGNFGLELLQTLSEQLEGEMQKDKSDYNFVLKNIRK